MVRNLIKKGKNLVLSPQATVLSAASVIMVMVVASRVLGLVRQVVLGHFFDPADLSLFFAAFRLPDLIFEVVVFGTFSSAFIPVFAKTVKKSKKRAWEIAGTVVNLGLLIFSTLAILIGIFAVPIYKFVAPGFSPEDVVRIAKIARILFAAQGFFVISYVLTGVLESLRHFLIPALAPLFYNIGIILGTVILAPSLGMMGPTIGVVVGAMSHFLIQLPFAYRFGFRFTGNLKPDEDVKKIGRLATPRIIDLSFQQVLKTVELSMSSLISTASYTFFTFANTLQLLPVSLFGTSLSKAALPTLARQDDDPEKFRKTFLNTFYQMMFFILPLVVILIVLRIPIIRLIYGRGNFDWHATLQTGYVLTAFALGVPFQASISLVSRAFYALHDTKTPLIVSLITTSIVIASNFIMIKVFNFDVWALAASYSLGVFIQSIILYTLLLKRINGVSLTKTVAPLYKSLLASIGSGLVMFVFLKTFDRSVWIKRLSFLGRVELSRNINFERFVLDTRYTFNLIILTTIVSLIGVAVYLVINYLLKSRELASLRQIIKSRKFRPIPKEPEPVSPTTVESAD